MRGAGLDLLSQVVCGRALPDFWPQTAHFVGSQQTSAPGLVGRFHHLQHSKPDGFSALQGLLERSDVHVHPHYPEIVFYEVQRGNHETLHIPKLQAANPIVSMQHQAIWPTLVSSPRWPKVQ